MHCTVLCMQSAGKRCEVRFGDLESVGVGRHSRLRNRLLRPAANQFPAIGFQCHIRLVDDHVVECDLVVPPCLLLCFSTR